MWVKRTEQEIAKIKARSKGQIFRLQIGIAVLMAYVLYKVTVYMGQPSDRTLFDGLIGVLCICIFLAGIRYRRSQPIMICPKCEKTKPEDSQAICACGGHFELIDTMKWV